MQTRYMSRRLHLSRYASRLYITGLGLLVRCDETAKRTFFTAWEVTTSILVLIVAKTRWGRYIQVEVDINS